MGGESFMLSETKSRYAGKKDPMATANALAVTIIFVYVVCALFFLIAPDFSLSVARTWFHGIDITRINARTADMSSFVLGLVTATISGWVVGYFFAEVYNSFLKK